MVELKGGPNTKPEPEPEPTEPDDSGADDKKEPQIKYHSIKRTVVLPTREIARSRRERSHEAKRAKV